MKNYLFLLLFSCLAAIILTGCASSPCFKVKVIDEKITVDGKLNEKAWKSAQEYRLQQIDDLSNTPYLTAAAVKRIPFELSKTSMLIDKDYLYIGIAMNDNSIFTEADKDQTKLVNLGDAVGINLMPMNKKCFWQFQFSPNKKYSSFYSDGLGSMSLPSTNDEKHFIKGIKFGVYTNKRPQSCWVAEIAIPLAELAKKGIELDNNWTVIVYRKNAGSNLRSIQNSSFPKMPMNNVNLVEYYSPIKFVK
jgi:hypothetical protein